LADLRLRPDLDGEWGIGTPPRRVRLRNVNRCLTVLFAVVAAAPLFSRSESDSAGQETSQPGFATVAREAERLSGSLRRVLLWASRFSRGTLAIAEA
jgi:hypothetical protein